MRSLLWVECAGTIWLMVAAYQAGDSLGMALAGGLAAGAAAGALTLLRHPLGWTLTLAIVNTSSVALLILLEEVPSPIQLVWTVMLWASVPMMARVMRVFQEEGGAFDRRLLEGHRGREGAQVRRARERRRRLLIRSGMGAAVLLVLGAGYGVSRVLAAPPDLEPSIARWVAAFAAGDTARIEALFHDDPARETWKRTLHFLEKRGWLEQGIELGKPRAHLLENETAAVEFPLPGGLLLTEWGVFDGDWQVTRLALRRGSQDSKGE